MSSNVRHCPWLKENGVSYSEGAGAINDMGEPSTNYERKNWIRGLCTEYCPSEECYLEEQKTGRPKNVVTH